MHHEYKPSDRNDVIIQTINDANLGWKADSCKLQKHHAQYCQDKASNTEGVILAQQASKNQIGEGEAWPQALKLAQQYRQKYASPDDIPDSELPQQFDWRDVNGYDFTGAVRDQKGCGSCYSFAFAQTMQSRLKVKYGYNAPPISA